jgi:predicted TIM-barrel fold metal-dependent hydrolase
MLSKILQKVNYRCFFPSKKFLNVAVVLVMACAFAGTGVIAEGTGSEKSCYVDTHMHLNGLYREKGRQSAKGVRGGRLGRGQGGPVVMQGERSQAHKEQSAGRFVKDYETAADNLIAEMNRLGVAKALIMPPPQIPGQTNAPDYQDLLPAVKKYPRRLILIAGGDVLNRLIHGTKASEVTPELKAQFKNEAEKLIGAGAKGFGEMAALHFSFEPRHVFEETSPAHPLFFLLADIAAEFNLAIDLHMEAVPQDMDLPAGFERVSDKNPRRLKENILALERLLDHNKNARIVWQHIGWDNTGYMTIELLGRLLKAHPNLYLGFKVIEGKFSVSGAPMPNRPVDRKGRIRPEWVKFISDFPDRFVIGGDEFVGIPGLTAQMPLSFKETWAFLEQLPPYLARKVGCDNAARVYNLN